MSENINQAHRLSIGASQTHKIMSYLQHDNLPNGAVSLISTMCRGTDEDLDNAYELNTPAIQWGRDHEVEAVELIAAEFEAEAVFYGENQLRLNAGFEYSNIISALCDAHLIMKDGSIVIPEIKALDTKNHDYIIAAVGDSAEALKREDWAKYCQVHTQNICAEMYYEKPVSSIIVFYDPRSTAIKLHYVIVVDANEPETIDREFREKLQQRAKLARNLYDSIKAEPERAAVIYDGVMPETKVVTSPTGFVLTPAILEMGCEEIARKVAESVGVEIVSLTIANDKDVDIHLKGGEVYDCEVKEGRELSKAREKEIKKIIPLVKKANAPLREAALAEHRKYTKTDRLIEALIMPIVNHVGAKRAEWETEQKRIQDEILAAEAEKKRLSDEKAEQVRQAILAKIETFTVSPQDASSLESIAAKRVQVENVVIDVMFCEFEQQAIYAKETALVLLDAAEYDLKIAAEEAEKQARLDAFNTFKAKCEALSDDTHSFEYLQSQLAKLTVATLPDDEYLVAASDLRIDVITMLNGSLIPAAKQRAVDLAEKLKAESAELAAKEVKDSDASIKNRGVVSIIPNEFVIPDHLKDVSKSETAGVIEQVYIDDHANDVPNNHASIHQCERVINENIIAMYAALNPILHAKVIEAAGKVMEFQNTPQNSRSSFLHNLFDADKQGKALRAAFCLIIK